MKNYLSRLKGSCIGNFASFFPTLPHPPSIVYDPTGTILAIYMARCPICFLQNISLIRLVVLGNKSIEWFLPYMGMAAILNFQSSPILA